MSKIKSYYFPVENQNSYNFESFESFDEYADECNDKSNVVRNTGLDGYLVNKHYDDQEAD